MIVSHKFGFIFVKTGKVAGTSLEMALSRFLGPEDIVTPVTGNDELDRYRRGFRTAQNFQKTVGQLRPAEWGRWLKASLRSRWRSGEGRVLARNQFPKHYWNHMAARDIRDRIGDEVWQRYFKFTVERNPWDKVVSAYYWDRKQQRSLSFREFVLSGAPLTSQFERYTVDGRVAMDRILRYERLYPELTELSERLGLPEDVGKTMQTLSAKGGYRPTPDVQGFYDDQTRELVEICFAREIRLLGFTFQDGTAP